mmetsp:Transcript_14626/g.22169  ORF Transcript_14626/g.22169 Transcript_14626/m.22169 type:complete len:220 (-) Transcript_14626:165-824(-)
MNLPKSLALVLSLFSCADAFGSFSFAKKAPAVNPAIVDEAVAIYDAKYNAKGTQTQTPFYNSWGIPKADVDGTPTFSSKPNKKLFDQSVEDKRKTFTEIAKLYGADEALDMTRALPGILAFDQKNFGPSLTEFSTIFGEDEAKAMVMRNPGLLYVKPENAATSDDLTMQFSYIVAITRPAGPFLLYGTLGLLTVPVIEGITGVSKVEFLKSIGVLSLLF